MDEFVEAISNGVKQLPVAGLLFGASILLSEFSENVAVTISTWGLFSIAVVFSLFSGFHTFQQLQKSKVHDVVKFPVLVVYPLSFIALVSISTVTWVVGAAKVFPTLAG